MFYLKQERSTYIENRKNKNIIIAMGVIIVALIGVVIYLLVKENNNANNDTNDKPEITDASKFADEYTELTDDNVFVYASVDEIIDTTMKIVCDFNSRVQIRQIFAISIIRDSLVWNTKFCR